MTIIGKVTRGGLWAWNWYVIDETGTDEDPPQRYAGGFAFTKLGGFRAARRELKTAILGTQPTVYVIREADL